MAIAVNATVRCLIKYNVFSIIKISFYMHIFSIPIFCTNQQDTYLGTSSKGCINKQGSLLVLALLLVRV